LSNHGTAAGNSRAATGNTFADIDAGLDGIATTL